MRRICRFKPCTRVTRKTVGVSWTILHFLVVVPSMGTPPAMVRMACSVSGLLTVTTYSFSCLFPARRILFTTSPSLVRNIRPWESLSSRPMGKMRSEWLT